MVTKSKNMIANQLRAQAQWCRQLGSTLYATLLQQAAADVEVEGPCWVVLQGHETDPLRSALALRFMGAVHRLVLQGRAPTLERHYLSVGADAEIDSLWPAFIGTVEQHREVLCELVLRPVQTNEVGRCAALLGGFLRVGQEAGLPLRLLEIGASAGLNLRWDYYRYETGGWAWGDPTSPVRLVGEFLKGHPPFDVTAHVVERRGCDINPLNPCSAEDCLTLMSYVWPDQTHRIELLQGALEVARRVPIVVETSDAAEWLESRLADPSSGTATVVFHSIFIQYLSEVERNRLRRVLEEAGRRASGAAPLAWLRMEPGANQIEVHLTTWPGGSERLVAVSGYHGQQVRCVKVDMVASPI